jgi:hypothetical protein
MRSGVGVENGRVKEEAEFTTLARGNVFVSNRNERERENKTKSFDSGILVCVVCEFVKGKR